MGKKKNGKRSTKTRGCQPGIIEKPTIVIKNPPLMVKQHSKLNQSKVDQQPINITETSILNNINKMLNELISTPGEKKDQPSEDSLCVVGTDILNRINVNLQASTDKYNNDKKDAMIKTEQTTKHINPVLQKLSILTDYSEKYITTFELNQLHNSGDKTFIKIIFNPKNKKINTNRDSRGSRGVQNIYAVWTCDSVTVFGVNYNISTKFTLEQQDELVEHLTIQLKAFSS